MSRSRRQILNALRAGASPFPDASAPADYRPMVPRAELDRQALRAQFVEEAERLDCHVHGMDDEAQALQMLLEVCQDHSPVSCWEEEQIPLSGLYEALEAKGSAVTTPDDDAAAVGVSGAQAALAATGSLVLLSGPGRFRATSLLPPVHVAVIREEQIVPDLESWLAAQRQDSFAQMRGAANVAIISGPSRTADIAMEPVMGMHGPREVHVILLGGN